MSTEMNWVYKRRGGPLVTWANGVPNQSRAASLRGLGSLGDSDTFGIQRPLLPRPGSPEFLDDPFTTLGGYGAGPSSSPPIKQYGLGGVGGKKKGCGCGCKGKKKGGCGPKKAMSEYVATGEYINAMGEYVGMGDDAPVPTTVAVPVPVATPTAVLVAPATATSAAVVAVPVDSKGRPMLDANGLPINYPPTAIDYLAAPGSQVLAVLGVEYSDNRALACTAGLAYLAYRLFRK